MNSHYCHPHGTRILQDWDDETPTDLLVGLLLLLYFVDKCQAKVANEEDEVMRVISFLVQMSNVNS